MALLVYSDKCRYCVETLSYIKTQPSLLQILRFHNVSTQGVPSSKITRVPSLVTNDGKLYEGGDVRDWLESMIPMDIVSFTDSKFAVTNLDDMDSANSDMFDLDMYGVPLQPHLTPDLKKKIEKRVNDALSDYK